MNDHADDSGAPLLEVDQLRMEFPITRGLLGRTVGRVGAVDGVDLVIGRGETLGLVGESGCGKSTLGGCVVRRLTPTSGRVRYRPPDGAAVDLAALDRGKVRRYQREVRLIFQDPFTALNPRFTLLEIVGEPLRNHRIANGSELEDRVAAMLEMVGLSTGYMRRYPHAFSGGERQRVNIARALIVRPRLVVADEPVSALDVSVRAQILGLLRDLRHELGLTYLFISHDLSVVESICDRVAVMYLGRIVEQGDTAELYAAPHHPYTEALLSAVPRPDPGLRDRGGRIRLADELPDASDPPPGCRFHTRCHYARHETCAKGDDPEYRDLTPGRQVACHFADQLELTGVAGLATPVGTPGASPSEPPGPPEGRDPSEPGEAADDGRPPG